MSEQLDQIQRMMEQLIQMTANTNAPLNKAKQWQFITSNPCDYVEPPKAVRKKKQVPDISETTNFFATARK
ncbi:hypothetical protein SCACP_08680 [Sporomusa carbonis]|uniref:hypothetical protein n=1 Tax=Sporomusa carbonis TaxID=3076075 RepID=UPI003A62803C